MIKDLLKYGNELEICGMVVGNGDEQEVLLFPDAINPNELGQVYDIIKQFTHEEWKELLYQLDTLGVQGLDKIVLRKSQRQIEQNVSWNVFRRDNYKCRYCGNDKIPLTIDHVILWEKMGDSVEDNLISACRKCNKTRGNMDYMDWLKSDYYLKVSGALTEPEKLSNYAFYEGASKVKLRPTQRNR
jgi:hypothetical protein